MTGRGAIWPWAGGVFTTLGIFVVQHWIQRQPSGSPDDPLAYKGELPAAALMLEPEMTSESPDAIAEQLEDWTGIPRANMAPLVAEFMLVTNDGSQVYGHNPVNARADDTWTGMWTMAPEAVISSGRPRYQWQPIRAYPSLGLGVADWVRSLPAELLAKLADGDEEGASEMIAGAAQAGGASRMAAHLLDAANRWRAGLVGNGATT